MSVVSGLSTSTGVSTLLNARREALDTTQAAPGEPAREEAARRAEGAPRGRGDRLSRRPVFEPSKNEQPAPSSQERGADGSRHTKFMLAVQALRLDYNEINASSPKLNAMLKAAREIFMADDGIPRQVTASYPAGLSDKFKFQEADQRAAQERAIEQQRAEATARAEAARAEAEDARTRAAVAEERAVTEARTRVERPDTVLPEPTPVVEPERPAAEAITQAALAGLPTPGEAPPDDSNAEQSRLDSGGPRDARFVDPATPSEAPEEPGALELDEGAAPPPAAGTDAAIRAEGTPPPPAAGTDAAIRAEATAPPPPSGTTDAPTPTAGTDAALRLEQNRPEPPAGTTGAPEPTAGTDAALRAQGGPPPSLEEAPASAPPTASERAAEAAKLEDA